MADKKPSGMEQGLVNYGDAEFSLFMRKAFIKAMGYTDDALGRPERLVPVLDGLGWDGADARGIGAAAMAKAAMKPSTNAAATPITAWR